MGTESMDTATELAARLERGELTAEALLRECIARADAHDGTINAFLSRRDDEALEQARASDARRAAGDARGPLEGIPVALKDLIAARGEPLTCASRMLERFVSPYDSTVAERLRGAGAVLWGRANMDEFAMGSSGENSAFGPTRNPVDPSRAPGGSSSGSAAAVAAGFTPLALGSDTGGSIRQPASFCGVVGLKPTYGRVSRYGLVAFASSLDQIGPFARSVEDAATVLGIIAGHDPRDSTSYPAAVPDFRVALGEHAGRRWRIGVPKEFFGDGLDPEVREAVREAIAWYRESGCEIVEISLPGNELAVPVYYVIATAEASSNLMRYDGVRYTIRAEESSDIVDMYFKTRALGFGPEVKRRIILGSYVLSSGYYDAYYKRAQKVRTLIRRDFEKAFEAVDLIATPTSPTAAFGLGEKIDDPLSLYLADIYTLSVNLAGLPGISLPCGQTTGGLPIGLQLIGKAYGEAELLAAAHRYETRGRPSETR